MVVVLVVMVLFCLGELVVYCVVKVLGCQVYGCINCVDQVDVFFENVLDYFCELFVVGMFIIGVCVLGILICGVVLLLVDKMIELLVVFVVDDGSVVVFLLGGYCGVNCLVVQIVEVFGVIVVVMMVGDVVMNVVLDELFVGYCLVNLEDVKFVMVVMLVGKGVIVIGDNIFDIDVIGGVVELVVIDVLMEMGVKWFVYYLQNYVLGVGCVWNVDLVELW